MLWDKSTTYFLHLCYCILGYVNITLSLVVFYLYTWKKEKNHAYINWSHWKLTCRWEWIPSCESLNQAIMYLDNLIHSWLDVRLPLRASNKLGWHGILPLWPHVSGVELNGALCLCCLSTEQLQLETKGKSTN